MSIQRNSRKRTLQVFRQNSSKFLIFSNKFVCEIHVWFSREFEAFHQFSNNMFCIRSRSTVSSNQQFTAILI